MNVVRYQPVNMFRQFHDQVNRLLVDELGNVPGSAAPAARPLSAWAPVVDVKEEDKQYVITADVPGVDPKHIEITMEAGVLSIKGSRSTASTEQSEAYSRIERGYGEFERRFNLPEGADADGITATSNHGVLNVSIPKKVAPAPRRIEIQ